MLSLDSKIAQLYPWQLQQWEKLELARNEKRLPHALLLTGPDGMGKRAFALTFAKSLLCHAAIEFKACGKCNACQLFNANTHPDLYWIAPEEEGKAIKVDQIREMTEKNSLTAHLSSYKIHLITEADRMNIAASNSLLKTLEEPSPNSLIILISSSPELLSATIKSRCQTVKFPPPDQEAALKWLEKQTIKSDPKLLLSMAHGGPLRALAFDQADTLSLRDEVFKGFGQLVFGKTDPVKVASQWQGHDLHIVLNWMTIWVIDMIRLKYNHAEPIIDNTDKTKALLKIASAFSLQQLFELYQKQLQASRLLNKQLNKLLLLESLLIPWVANAR